MKPAPVLTPERTHDQNLDAIRRHFTKTSARYGPHVRRLIFDSYTFSSHLWAQTVIHLAEQSGKEAAITTAYRQYVEEMNEKDVQWVAVFLSLMKLG